MLLLSIGLGSLLGDQTFQASPGLPESEKHWTLAEGSTENETFQNFKDNSRVQVTVQACRGIWRELLPEEGDHACLGSPQAVADV